MQDKNKNVKMSQNLNSRTLTFDLTIGLCNKYTCKAVVLKGLASSCKYFPTYAT